MKVDTNGDSDALLFVYGSLLSGLVNHEWLKGEVLVDGDAWTDEGYAMLYGGDGQEGCYPYVLSERTARGSDVLGSVRGELYNVSKSTLARIDALECHPVEYERRVVPVAGRRAWLYEFVDPDELHAIYTEPHRFINVPRRDWRTFAARCLRRAAKR